EQACSSDERAVHGLTLLPASESDRPNRTSGRTNLTLAQYRLTVDRLLPSLTAGQLRRELNLRAEAWARAHRLLHELSPGPSPSVVFGVSDHGDHGNFHPASYARIVAHPDWARRLAKPHTASRRSVARKDWR